MATQWDASQLLRGLGDLAKRVRTGAERGLDNWAEYVKDEATRIVPIEEGTLKNSARNESDGLRAAVGFGSGASASYAPAVHERLEAHHKFGQAKYLEIPLMASRRIGMEIVAKTIRGEL